VQVIGNAPDMAKAEKEHRCGLIKAVEGGAVLGGSLEALDRLKAYQVRMMTLTWNGANELGNGCMSDDAAGLTRFGKDVVRRMEELDLLIDVSHLNERGFWDVAQISRRPFLATHSLSMTVCRHPRNLTDPQFDCICERGGLVGLNLCSAHLGEACFAAFERHLAHFLERDGEASVALGCDFDGTALPPHWNGIDTLSALEKQLIADGFGRETVDRLFYQNAYDFFSNL
jgi:membrane dipeptidase